MSSIYVPDSITPARNIALHRYVANLIHPCLPRFIEPVDHVSIHAWREASHASRYHDDKKIVFLEVDIQLLLKKKVGG